MFHLLVVAFLVATSTAQDLEADESAPPVQVYGLDEIHRHQHDGHHKHKPHNVYLHGVQDLKGQSKTDRIVAELYNPDYIEPITVLDYRYVKTGGRDYTRGAGGQILILPKNVRTNQRKEFQNYDELLEFLRIKQLAEIEAHHKEMSTLGYEHHRHNHHEHHIQVQGHPQHQHDYHHDHGYQQRPLYGYKREAEEPTPQQEAAI